MVVEHIEDVTEDDADTEAELTGDEGTSGTGSEVTAVGGFEMGEVFVLSMPARLDQKRTSRSLMSAVKGYFYPAYNSNPRFVRLLASVGNDDSVTKNRMFDRRDATTIIQDLARAAKDRMTAEAPSGHIYGCLVSILRSENMGLKLRREEYQRQLTHHQAAE